MPVSTSAPAPKHTQLTPEAQAAALWTFVQLKAPRFTFDTALEVVKNLDLRPGEEPKSLAKRLRKALQGCGIAFKHVNALHAASRMAGYSSWHANEEAGAPRLRFATLEGAAFDPGNLHVDDFSSWSELSTELRTWADRLLARGQLPLGVMTLNFNGQALNISTPVPSTKEDPQQRTQSWTLGTVTSLVEDPEWLEEAPAAFEKLRRHLEEGGKAVLDGYAVLQLCANSHDGKGFPTSVSASDVVNSELVLLREDDEDDPRSGYEIARGDELTCWHQMELSLRDDKTDALPEIRITVPDEGSGAWFVNGIRCVWVLETLKPAEYVPGRIEHFIGPRECERLLRRYRLAKRIHGKVFKHHDQTKHLAYLGGPPENYRVDLHFILRKLNSAGFTWEGYCEKFGAEALPMQDLLPVGFVFQLLQNLKIEDPNQAFAKPNLSEMARIEDDALLRSLFPRVDSVRAVFPRHLDPEIESKLREAADDFASGVRMQKLAGGALPMEKELPYLVYANGAEEFRATVDELGFVMYAAAMPHLLSTKGILPDTPNTWPWALGAAIFLRFERREGGIGETTKHPELVRESKAENLTKTQVPPSE